MSIVVTGASGRIGRVVAARLATDGWTVVPLESVTGRVDVRDADAVLEVVRRARPEAIVHLAGRTPPAASDDLLEGAERAARAVTRAAELSGARVVAASSAAVYGRRATGPMRESDESRPSGDYGMGKVVAERVGAEFADRSGLPHASLRIFNVVGPDFDGSLPTRLLRSTAQQPVTLRSLDGFVRDYVHVDDVADAISRVLRAQPPGATTWNVGSGVPTSNRALLAALRPREVHVVAAADAPEDEPDVSWADISRARAELGFAPRVDLGLDWFD